MNLKKYIYYEKIEIYRSSWKLLNLRQVLLYYYFNLFGERHIHIIDCVEHIIIRRHKGLVETQPKCGMYVRNIIRETTCS